MSFTLDDDEEDFLSPGIDSAPAALTPLAAAANSSFNIDEFLDSAVNDHADTVAPVQPQDSFSIDDFLDSDPSPVVASDPSPAVASDLPEAQPDKLDIAPVQPQESLSIDDFLDSHSSPSVVEMIIPGSVMSIPMPATVSEAQAAAPLAATHPPAAVVDDDFLSWLDNSPAKSTSAPAEVPPPVTILVEAKSETVEVKNNLLEDASSDAAAVHPPTASHFSTQKNAQTLKYESELLKIITSGFPDVSKLQSLIASKGYIPRDLRGQVWSLLLSGTCSEDQEADFWQSTGLELPNHTDVVSDCNAVIQKCRSRGLSLPSATLDQAKRDLVDILVLYCVRRTIPYKPLYCDLLAPMLVTAKPLSRTVASSCFYSLCSEFIPVVNLPVLVQDHVSEKLHEMLRLLLQYHYPKLCSHLDRVLKGWEKKTDSFSAAMAIKFDAAARDREELDELERDFGLSLPGDTTPEDASKAVVSNTFPTDVTNGGKIPENWLYCIFGGSIPLDLSCWMWDWVLSSGDKFSGLYVVVSLFGLYAEALREMSGPQISNWIETIAKGVDDKWFLKLPFSNEGSVRTTVPAANMSWDAFIRGWIHAAEAIRHATPTSFQVSLNNIEKWAITQPGPSVGNTANILENSIGSTSDLGANGTDRSSDTVAQGTGGSSLLIERLRRISMQMQKPPEGGASTEGIRGRFSRVLGAGATSVEGSTDVDRGTVAASFPGHATPILSSRCVWANVAEVVPCLCSSSKQRQAVSLEKRVLIAFEHGAKWGLAPTLDNDGSGASCPTLDSETAADGSDEKAFGNRGGEGFVIPLMAGEKDQPFYFGIDCRAAANEISLGKFPKAYCLDPEDLKDSYLTSTVLKILEPMVNQVHFCIIGVGEEFFVHRAAVLAAKAGNRRGSDAVPTVEALRTEYYQGVAAVLDFFQKRDFKHFSFLEGGFTAAVRHLMKEECPYSISSSLVDVDPDMLDSVIGEGTAASFLNTRRGASGPSASSSSSTSASSSVAIGASGFLSSLSKADIFAVNKNGGVEDVVEVAPPQPKSTATGSGGLLSFMSSVKSAQAATASSSDNLNSNSSDKSATNQTVAASGAINPPASGPPGAVGGDLKSKMSLFGSSTLASLRRVSQSVGNQSANNIGTVASSSPIAASDADSNNGKGSVARESSQHESSAFTIDDDDEDDGDRAGAPDGPSESGNNVQPPAENKIKSTFITRVGGVLRSTTAATTSSDTPASSITGSVSRLGGGGLVDIDPDKIGISKTEAEKAQALAMHKLAGVRKGDQVTINRESLPGALLFPARKIKMAPVPRSPSDTTEEAHKEPEMQEVMHHRYIVVTKERVIVLDSGGGGVGSISTVKSNHHLTELVKLTFKKRDPELLTLFVANSLPGMPDDDENGDALDEKQRGGAVKSTIPPKQKQYRVTKREELVEVLQKYMTRFR